MQLLHQTPAETWLLLYGSSSSLKDLLKVTFMDLILKKVIQSVEFYRTPKGNQKPRFYKYITIDKNFSSYQPKLHELVFLAPFYVNVEEKILFRHLIAKGYKKSISKNHYQDLITQTNVLKGAFSQSVFQMIFGGRDLTEMGLKLKNDSIQELLLLEDVLPKQLSNQPKEALKTLTNIHGNIFLLQNVVFDLKTEIEQDFMMELKRYERFG
jgi:hypothetical protein